MNRARFPLAETLVITAFAAAGAFAGQAASTAQAPEMKSVLAGKR